MALALHDPRENDRSRPRPEPRARDESCRRRPALHVVGGAAAMELDRRLLALSGRAARCRFVEGRLAAPLLARRGWTALGFVRLRDYARERLGTGARTVEESVRVATALESLPRTAAAFLDGTLTWTATRLLTGIATTRDEAGWIEKARRMDARSLETLIRQTRASGAAATTPSPSEEAGDDPRVRWSVRVSPFGARMWRAAHELAERTAGSRLTPAQVLELVAAEASGSVPAAAGGDPPGNADGNAERDRARRQLLDELRSAGSGDATVPDETAATSEHGAPLGAEDTGDPRTLVSLLSEVAAREGFPWLVPPEPPDATGPSARFERHVRTLEATDPFVIDERLRKVRRRAQRIDFDLASLLREAVRCRLYRDLGFSNLEQYVESRLGICARTAWTLLAIERACSGTSPRLAHAWRDGRLCTMAAQAIVRVLGGGHDDDWITRAAAVTLRRLEAEVDWARARLAEGRTGEPPPEGLDLAGDRLAGITTHELQMRARTAQPEAAARPPEGLQMRAHEDPAREAAAADPGFVPSRPITFFAPKSVCTLADQVTRALRVGSEPRGRAFERMLALALLEWTAAPRHRDPIFERDGWRCSVPGCTSRRNLHDHHIVFRSRGGHNARDNRITVCAAHHLHGLHRGRIRAHGRAPGEVTWEIGIRGGTPLFRTVGDRYVGPDVGPGG